MSRLARLRDVFVPSTDPERAYFCTYGFDPRFFEAELLSALLPNSISLDRETGSQAAYLNAADTALQRRDVGVFYDHLDGEGPELLNAAWRVAVAPMAFHAKLMLLDYGAFVRVVISSANLTRAAWTRNLELFVVDDLKHGTPHPWARGLRSFLTHLVEHVPAAHAEHREALRGLLADVPDGDEQRDRVTSSWDEPLLVALLAGTVAPRRLDVVTPFFEGADGDGVFDAVQAHAPQITGRLFVSTTTDHGLVQVRGPADKLAALLQSGSWTMHGVRATWEGDEPGAPERGLHGKALALAHDRGIRVMVGSANVTRAALLGVARSSDHAGTSNVEIALLREATPQEARALLPQADPLELSRIELVDREDGEDDGAPGPERFVLEATYWGRDGQLEILLTADAPPLTIRYQDSVLSTGSASVVRTAVSLGLARYVLVDDGAVSAIVPFTIVDVHRLIPRGSRSAVSLEDFLDVLAGARELPLRLTNESETGSADGGGAGADELVGRRGPIPWRRFLAAVHGLGAEIERERPFARGLRHTLESPIRLQGLRDHLEAAWTSGRLTDADLLYAFYELSRELERIRDSEDETAGRELIAKACAALRARRAELAAAVPAVVAAQLKILAKRDGSR